MQKWQGFSSIVATVFALGLNACSPKIDDPIAIAVEVGQIQKPMTSYAEPLGEEEMGISNVLEVPYAKEWVIIHDANFHSMIDGRFILMDSAAVSKAFKGTMHGGMVGGVDVSEKSGEIYIATTYHSRGISGERTDIIAIHDPTTLEKSGEIILPAKRGANMPFKNSFRLSGDDSLSFNYNFTPAASISVTDMQAKSFLKEVPIPGCTLAFPMGDKGFASLCGDGAMIGVQLDGGGNVIAETRSETFNNIDDDSLFLKPARFGNMLYFPTFKGNLQPVDLSGNTPVPLEKWALVSKAEKAENWRPGGWQLIAGDNANTIYILMHPGGVEGSHKNGGPEVWVFDILKKKRIGKIKLKTWGVSVAVAAERLIVTNAEMQLDIYDLSNLKYSHTFGDGIFTPFIVYNAQGQ